MVRISLGARTGLVAVKAMWCNCVVSGVVRIKVRWDIKPFQLLRSDLTIELTKYWAAAKPAKDIWYTAPCQLRAGTWHPREVKGRWRTLLIKSCSLLEQPFSNLLTTFRTFFVTFYSFKPKAWNLRCRMWSFRKWVACETHQGGQVVSSTRRSYAAFLVEDDDVPGSSAWLHLSTQSCQSIMKALSGSCFLTIQPLM